MSASIDSLQICPPCVAPMAGADWIKTEVENLVPHATVEVSDLHGTGDHFHVRVISDSFEGMLPLERQRPILDFFTPHIKSGTVHALDLKCMTTSQAKAAGETVFDPHGEGEKQFLGIHIRRPKE